MNLIKTQLLMLVVGVIGVTQINLTAQEAQPERVTKEQWAIIQAANAEQRYAEAAALQEAIIINKAIALDDRVRALLGYVDLVDKKRSGADASKIPPWIEAFAKLPGQTAASWNGLTRLLLKQAEQSRDEARIEQALQEGVASDLLDMRSRSEYAGRLAKMHLLKTDDIPGAAKIITPLLDAPNLAERDIMFVCKELGEFWKLAGDLEKALAAYQTIYEKAPALASSAAAMGRDAYLAFGEPDKARAYFMKHADDLSRAREDRDLALKLLADEKSDDGLRRNLFKLFLDNTPEDAAVRKKYAGLYADGKMDLPSFGAQKGSGVGNDRSPGVGSYNYIMELLEYAKNNRSAESMEYILLKIKALAGLERTAEIPTVIAEYRQLQNSASKPIEIHLLKLIEAVLVLPDKKGLVKDVIEKIERAGTTQLTPAEQSAALLNLASVVSHARKHDLALDIYDCHEGRFAAQPRRSTTAVFSMEPVGSIDAFLRIKETLQHEPIARRYRGDLEMLVATDIASGSERAAALKAQEEESATRGKLYVLCDLDGLHIFVDMPEADGRAFAAGLSDRRHTYELYFAPGWNQPYFCAGLRFNVDRGGFVYQTTYNNILHKRFEENSSDFHTEVRHYDKGFYVAINFGWNTIFDKLPDTPEKFFEFDLIDWAPGGGMAWSSRLNVHSRLEWGRIYFKFTPEQLAAIRGKIIFAARSEYLAERNRPNGPVDLWQDEVLGDPDFNTTCVQPLVEKLNGYLNDVKTDMDAATIERLCREALPGWMRLRYHVARLRAEYLKDALTRE